jgi:hypothetical protein
MAKMNATKGTSRVFADGYAKSLGTVSLVIRQVVNDRAERLFAYAGDANVEVMNAVLSHAEALAVALPGACHIEMIASGQDSVGLRQLVHVFRQRVRCGSIEWVVLLPNKRRRGSRRMQKIGCRSGEFWSGSAMLH